MTSERNAAHALLNIHVNTLKVGLWVSEGPFLSKQAFLRFVLRKMNFRHEKKTFPTKCGHPRKWGIVIQMPSMLFELC